MSAVLFVDKHNMKRLWWVAERKEACNYVLSTTLLVELFKGEMMHLGNCPPVVTFQCFQRSLAMHGPKDLTLGLLRIYSLQWAGQEGVKKWHILVLHVIAVHVDSSKCRLLGERRSRHSILKMSVTDEGCFYHVVSRIIRCVASCDVTGEIHCGNCHFLINRKQNKPNKQKSGLKGKGRTGYCFKI